MVTPPTPTCWRCGSPVFNHFFRGYVCPHCENIRALKNIARNQQTAQQVHHEYYDDGGVEEEDGEDNPIVAFAMGCMALYFVVYVAYYFIHAITGGLI